MPQFRSIVALAACMLTYTAYGQKGQASRQQVKPPLEADVSSVNNPNQGQLDQGASGSAVVRAQILLARAHFSCGEIDGHFGTNLRTTIRAFQQDRGLPVTGSVDSATWSSLNSDTAAALISSTVGPQDVQGPFVTIPPDLMKQATLPALWYGSPLEQLSEHFHMSPELTRALNPGMNFAIPERQLNVPNIPIAPPGPAARIVASKGESSVRALDDKGQLMAFFIATSGSTHDPLPVGEWKIRAVFWNPKFHYNATLFWDAKNTDDRATIQPGPNNPVGVVWIDLSKDHYGIHGTSEPGMVGHAYSHGCIRLTNWDAAELAAMVKPGTPATLQE